MTNDINLQILSTRVEDADLIARLAGKDAYGSEFMLDVNRAQLAAICNVIMKSEGDIFPVISMERVGCVAKIEIAGNAEPIFDLLEKMLTVVKQ